MILSNPWQQLCQGVNIFYDVGHVKKQGFTLIELMIVVAIIAVLAFAGVQKFGNMIQTSNEGNTISNLGALRSALNIYYSDNGAVYPMGVAGENESTLADSLIPKYVGKIPDAYAYSHHDKSNEVDNVSSLDFAAADPTDDGGWVYVAVNTSADVGKVAVECYHPDSKGNIWSGR